MSDQVITGWVDKGVALIEHLASMGVNVYRLDGVYYSNDPLLAQTVAASFDAAAKPRADKIAKVKEEAQRRIFNVLPAYKQTNLMAQGLENTLAYGPDATQWPAEQKAIKAFADARWARIKALRAASDAIEAKLNAMSDWQAIEAHDATTDPDWPE